MHRSSGFNPGLSRTAVGPGRIASRSGMSSATIRASRSSARQAVRRADELGFAETRERRRSRSTGGAAVRSIGSRGSETGKTSLPDPKNWRDPRHWRFSWREGISVDSVRRPPRLLARTLKVVLAVVTACVALIAGVITADSLSSNDTSETLTVPISTVRAATSRDGYSQEADVAALTPPALPPSARGATRVRTMVVTTTSPAETKVVTVRRNGHTLVVRKPGETVTSRLTVPGPVRERVVTSGRVDTVVRTETRMQTTTTDRLVTVTTPAVTQTVSRTVTQPSSTVTQTRVVTVHEPAQVVTVTRPVTVTNELTVTVTDTGNGEGNGKRK